MMLQLDGKKRGESERVYRLITTQSVVVYIIDTIIVDSLKIWQLFITWGSQFLIIYF